MPGAQYLRTAVGLSLVATPLALGGAHAPVNAILALCLVGLLVLIAWHAPEEHTISMSLPIIIVFGALAATLLQLVPLPLWVIGLLSSGAHDALSLDHARSWAPLSMDPPATAHEVLKLCAYAAGALAAAGLFVKRVQRRELMTWIAGAGGVVSVLGFVHGIARLDRPWGTFGYAGNPFVSTFINPNHLAGFLGFTSFVALGLAMSSHRLWRWTHGANAVVIGAGVILSLSRGGIVCYFGALAFMGLVVLLNKTARGRGLFWIQLSLAGVLLLAGYLAYSQIVHEMWTLSRDNALQKTEVWAQTPQILHDFPVLGIGRGAFASVYPRYRPSSLTATFTHLENEWLQTLVDWGPVLGILMIAGFLLAFGRVLGRASQDTGALAAASGLLFLAGHNLGDFNLQVTAVGLPALLTIAVYSRHHAESDPLLESRVWRLLWGADRLTTRPILALAGVLGCATLCCVYPAIAFEIRRDTSRLTDRLAEARTSADLRQETAVEVTRRHPADYLLPLLAGQRELREKDGAKRALPWINRSMFLAPSFGTSHRLAGRALYAIGAREQALLEYRLACERDPSVVGPVLKEVFGLTQDLDDVAKMAESGPAMRLAAARFVASENAPALVVRLADGGDTSADLWEMATLAQVQLGNFDDALARAQALEQAFPGRSQSYLFQADLLLKKGDDRGAMDALDRGLSRADQRQPILWRKATAYLSKGRLDEARRIASEIAENAQDRRAAAQGYWLLGQFSPSATRSRQPCGNTSGPAPLTRPMSDITSSVRVSAKDSATCRARWQSSSAVASRRVAPLHSTLPSNESSSRSKPSRSESDTRR